MVITEIWRYPVKSMGGEQLERASITDLGIEFDRGWGIFHPESSTVLTGRREPKLLLASAAVTDGRLTIVTDGDRVIDADVEVGAGIDVGSDVDADTDGGRAAMSDALSSWLGYAVELRRAESTGGTFETPIDPDTEQEWVSWTGPPGAWHDSARTRVSILAVAEAAGIDPRRFRANLIIDNSPTGPDGTATEQTRPTSWDPNEWVGQRIQIGSNDDGVRLDVLKGIERCVMVARPQRDLVADLDALRWVIRERDNLMGLGALVDTPGICAVDDEIAVDQPSTTPA